MRGKSHLAIGLLTTVEATSAMGISISPIGVLLSIIFSIIPDIDEANSSALNKLISKSFTRKLHRLLLYSLLILSVFFYSKTNSSLYIILFLSLTMIGLVEKKVTENFVRSTFISMFFLIITAILVLFRLNISVIMLSALLCIFPVTKHRSLSHTAIMPIFIYFLMKYFEMEFNLNNIAIPSAIAYSSHLACDICTKRGIPIFSPIYRKNISIANLKVGSFLCNFVEVLAIGILVSLLLFMSFKGLIKVSLI